MVRRIALPLLLAGAGVVASLLLSGMVRDQQRAALDLAVEEYARQTAEQIEGQTRARLLSHRRMAHRWVLAEGGHEPAWRADAIEYLRDHPEVQAIEWVDATSRIRWIEPLAGNEAAVGLVLNTDGPRYEARRRATRTGELALSDVIELVQGGPGLLAYEPLTLDGVSAGHLVFVIRPGELIEQVLGPDDQRFEVSVTDHAEPFFQRGSSQSADAAEQALEVGGATWRVRVRPSPVTAELYETRTPAEVLLIGLVLSLALGLMTWTALQSRHHRRRVQVQSDELQSILDLLPAMVWYKDRHNTILRANATAARGVGVTPEAMAGQPTAEFYPDTAETYYQGDLEVMASGEPRLGIVEPIVTEQGPRQVQTDKLPVTDAAGHVTGIIVVATDITEVLNAQAQARTVSERFEAFMRNDPEMKWAVDAAGRYAYINPAYAKVMGITPDECLGRTPAEVLGPRTTQTFLDVAQRTNQSAVGIDAPITFEVSVPIGDRVIPLFVTKFVFRDAEGGQLIGGSALDLSAVKDVQRKLAKHNQDLETLLHVISHDLREPLRTISSFSEIVSEEYGQALDDRGRDMLARVVRGADRLDKLLLDVLLLSRAQRAEPTESPVEMAQVLGEVLQSLQPTIEASGGSVEVRGGLPVLRIDPFWLRQALYNLLVNALKFTRPGETPQVEVEAYEPGPGESSHGVVVRDRGPGVLPEHREVIFGLFQRAVGRGVPGNGTGLAIVAQVAERYGGRAWVRERPGGGSEFILTVEG